MPESSVSRQNRAEQRDDQSSPSVSGSGAAAAPRRDRSGGCLPRICSRGVHLRDGERASRHLAASDQRRGVVKHERGS